MKKGIAFLLAFTIFSAPIHTAAQSFDRHSRPKVKIGNGLSGDREIEFDVGDSPNPSVKFDQTGDKLEVNRALDIDGAVNATGALTVEGATTLKSDTTIEGNTLTIGDGESGDKKIILNDGSGADNAEIFLDQAAGQLKFKEPGGTAKRFGSGSGGGGSGLNTLIGQNHDMEDGAVVWTSNGSGTIEAEETIVANGEKSLKWTPGAALQWLRSATVTVSETSFGRLSGGNCSLVFWYQTSALAGEYTFRVVDGAEEPLAEWSSEPASKWTQKKMTFICPEDGTIRVDITAEDHPVDPLYLDDVHLGSFDLLQIKQGGLYGYAVWDGASGCTWSTTSSGSFPADSDCPDPTLGLKAEAPGSKIPAITFSNLPAGRYTVFLVGNHTASSLGQVNYFVSDGGNGGAIHGPNQYILTSSSTYTHTIMQIFEYTEAVSSATFRAQVSLSGPTAMIQNSSTSFNYSIYVYYDPLNTTEAFKPADGPAFAEISYEGATDCNWLGTATPYSDLPVDSDCTTPTLKGRASEHGDGKKPGLRVSNLPAGSYLVMAAGSFVANNGISCQFRIHDSDTGAGETGVNSATSSTQLAQQITGVFHYSSFQAHRDFVIQAWRTDGMGGSCGIANNTSGRHKFTMTIIPISWNSPQPVIVNSVVSPYAGVAQVLGFSVNGSGGVCTISSDPAGVVESCSHTSPGVLDVTLKSGIFSDTPMCSNDAGGTNDRGATVSVSSSTSMVVYRYTASTGSATGGPNNVICWGVK